MERNVEVIGKVPLELGMELADDEDGGDCWERKLAF